MSGSDPKAALHRYLQIAREALIWKLDGLSEYDVRRPMVPTGTNLLGLVKHVASVELGYFGDTFGRPSGEPLPWFEDDAEPNADLWATAETNRHAGHADIVRELIDGSAGLRAGSTNLPAGDDTWWEDHRDRVERAARQAGGGASGPPAS